METRTCIVKMFDADCTEHTVKVQAESVYEAALKGFERFDRIGIAKDDSTMIVEIYEEPTVHHVSVGKVFGWLKSHGRNPVEEVRKQKLRELVKISP